MNPLFIIGVVAYIAVEWFAASLLAHWIGWGGVALVMMVLFIIGVAVCRRAGFSALRASGPVTVDGVRVSTPTVSDTSTALKAVGDAGLRFISGLAIAIPGLISSSIGLLMLIAPIRRGVGLVSMRQFRRRAQAAGIVVDDRLRPTTFRDGSVPGSVYRPEDPREPGAAIEGVVLDD